MKQQINEAKRMQQLAGLLKENEYTPKYNEKDAFNLFDYHQRTGMLPKDMTEEEFDELMAYYGIKNDNEDFTDPAGGSGIRSHV